MLGISEDLSDEAVLESISNLEILVESTLTKISLNELHENIAKELLTIGKATLVGKLYINGTASTQLSMERLESICLSVTEEFISTAPSCDNVQIDRAIRCIDLLYPHFLDSRSLQQTHTCLEAIKELSHYRLESPDGVILPVQIIHDPNLNEMFTTLVDQNPGVSNDPDNLLEIATKLVEGKSTKHNKLALHAHILSACVQDALARQDFKLAYTICGSRLDRMAESDTEAANHAWQAFYLLGKHVSFSGIDEFVQEKHHALAVALKYCPPEQIDHVISTWRASQTQLSEIYKGQPPLNSTHHLNHDLRELGHLNARAKEHISNLLSWALRT
ncbi:hypothetical protein CANCADRAFT_577 [Tortispora caseinolytica NRRL Y-17796]|uniref:Sec39 domain-containing protein n=1 Tax=Tortispora caseinolytica NRRL Y-17796 TaxID=767744 RepID=A0A1E4TJS3_9ASCO|nr:hypothetical protein CANCADRAFT_577 [Tortispora caseinolytica NRRL Y-17796]